MRVAAFTKYDRQAASTRQRLLQFLPSLEAAGIAVDYHSLLGDGYVQGLVAGQRPSPAAVAGSYLRRLGQLLAPPDCDVIWVYAELFPFLPAQFERLAFLGGKPLIYDFDDAFFAAYQESPNALVRRGLGDKLEPLLRGAAACTCGNDYLRDYAARFCERTLVVPTVVDTGLYRPLGQIDGNGPPTIGWIGSPSTWVDVRPLLPLLSDLHRETGARFRAVGAGAAAAADRFEGLDLVDWSEAGEVAEVQAMDIGIMPVRDLPFQRGKSGYKLVQYMACGLPVVASPVGVNRQIVTEGVNGFLALDDGQWREALLQLIADAQLRRRMGQAGRRLVEDSYSLASQAPRLVELFQSVAASR